MVKITTKRLEEYGFNVTKSKDGYELNQETPAGEDWLIFIGRLKDLKIYTKYFDPAEELKNLLGCRGCPDVATLWEDQLWKQNLLNEIVSGVSTDQRQYMFIVAIDDDDHPNLEILDYNLTYATAEKLYNKAVKSQKYEFVRIVEHKDF